MAGFLEGLGDFVSTGVDLYKQDRQNESDIDLATLNLQAKLAEQQLSGLEPALDENPNASPTRAPIELLAGNQVFILVAVAAGALVLLKVAKVI